MIYFNPIQRTLNLRLACFRLACFRLVWRCGFFSLMVTGCLLGFAQDVATDSSKKSESDATKPRFEIMENAEGLVVNVDGKLFAKYFLYQANKPYLWPVIGPTGKPMTRSFPMKIAENENEKQRDHPHHRGILFGHDSHGRADWEYPKNDEQWSRMLCDTREMVGGDTWHERATFADYRRFPQRALDGVRRPATLASIRHREFKKLDASDDRAVVVQICDYLDRDGRRFLVEERRMTFRATPDARSIDFDQTFRAADSDVVFHDKKDAGLAIRVPASMAIASKQGGHVINSEGDRDQDAWSKRAKWCDYSGPVDGEVRGIAILNHPTSYRFPTRWHVRDYGLFTANPFGQKAFDRKLEDGTTRLKRNETLTLRHRFLFHAGTAEEADIEKAWLRYRQEVDDATPPSETKVSAIQARDE